MTPRQQREARAIVRAFLRHDCSLTDTCMSLDEISRRIHDRARLWLAQTAPKPARRKKA